MSEHDISHDAKDSEAHSGAGARDQDSSSALDHGAGVSIVPDIDNEFGDDCAPGAQTHDSESKDVVLHRQPSSWEDIVFGESRLFEEAGLKPSPTRHALSIVSIVAIAAVMGALSGAGTTWGVGYLAKNDRAKDQIKDQARQETASRDRSINDAISQMASELQALKANADSAAKANAAKLAKLGEALDKMKAPETTGSIPTATQPAPLPAPKPLPVPQMAQPPIVDGWILREVANGAALVEGRGGMFEVYAGDPLPGLGRVEGIHRQDGRWVVITTRGLIISR